MTVLRTSEWRLAADPTELREYDRFGPWIDRVLQEQDMPRRYLSWYPELAGATYLVKVPLPYDREQIRPGMELYASVLAVFADRLVVLKAAGPSTIRTDVGFDQIVATSQTTNLLIGEWVLFGADGTSFGVEYNSVSRSLVAEIDRFVRRRPAVDIRVHSTAQPVIPRDHYLRTKLIELSRTTDDQLVPVYVDEPRLPCRDLDQTPGLSAGSMLVDSPAELLVVDRGQPTQRLPRRRALHKTRVVSIAYDRMTSFTVIAPAPEPPGQLHHLLITSGQQTNTLPCLRRPDGAVAALLAHGVRLV